MKTYIFKIVISFIFFLLAFYFFEYDDIVAAKLGMSSLFSFSFIKYIKILLPILNFIIAVLLWIDSLFYFAILFSIIITISYLLYSSILYFNVSLTCDCGNIFPML